MTTEQLQNVIKAAPFRPFSLKLADGRSIPVPHPELIAHRSGGRTAVVIRPDDAVEILDLLLVVGIEIEQPAGGRRRK